MGFPTRSFCVVFVSKPQGTAGRMLDERLCKIKNWWLWKNELLLQKKKNDNDIGGGDMDDNDDVTMTTTTAAATTAVTAVIGGVEVAVLVERNKANGHGYVGLGVIGFCQMEIGKEKENRQQRTKDGKTEQERDHGHTDRSCDEYGHNDDSNGCC